MIAAGIILLIAYFVVGRFLRVGGDCDPIPPPGDPWQCGCDDDDPR